MELLGRHEELSRLDAAASRAGAFTAVWGRRRVGKSRLLTEWSRRRNGLYLTADQTVAPVQRRYLAAAVAERFAGFADGDDPDWPSFFQRLANEARRAGWPGPLILDELPNLLAADAHMVFALRNLLDHPEQAPNLVVCGSSHYIMHAAVVGADAPLYGRAVEAFAVEPLKPGYLRDAFPDCSTRDLVSAYAVWGALPGYWELAAPFGRDLDSAVDTLVLDPAGSLHDEPHQLLSDDTPSGLALRPLLDAIGTGAHRVSEVARHIDRPASSLPRPMATLTAMDLVRRDTPFGSDPQSDRRSLYHLADPFWRFWFRVVAPNRSALAASSRETRLGYWRKHRAALESRAWEELCRLAVPALHHADSPLARLGPWAPAQRYWRTNDPSFDVVAQSVDGRRILVGETRWRAWGQPIRAAVPDPTFHPEDVATTLGIDDREIVSVLFDAEGRGADANAPFHIVDADTVMTVLR